MPLVQIASVEPIVPEIRISQYPALSPSTPLGSRVASPTKNQVRAAGWTAYTLQEEVRADVRQLS
ncbi:hypothetical protein DACRYDRAFT_22338 [Dacryopinax primogenitus]|uniref:Uncharacterized protein n=1 Tax=Dacryopinax primogenitus (strain DJM 731) TaxID=1858805 RepID=M5GCP6_DACPD|nr:uncharacterized protein DACRYDRAFT_22338 [Dacryopinax primogenitus]EJU01898.1 hypothetical protein DACRYDRAFT_22338 [Dacryopinax primogenitus]